MLETKFSTNKKLPWLGSKAVIDTLIELSTRITYLGIITQIVGKREEIACRDIEFSFLECPELLVQRVIEGYSSHLQV